MKVKEGEGKWKVDDEDDEDVVADNEDCGDVVVVDNGSSRRSIPNRAF